MVTYSSREKMLKITTSWDDGDILDKRLADLLSQYRVKGTFYVTKNYRPERLSEKDIGNIAQNHEVGAHTLSHPDLRTLGPEKLKEEITGSKKWLENILDSEVKMFCYPKGFYNPQVTRAVKEAGLLGARTTILASITKPDDPFQLHTTLQVYPFPFRKLNQEQHYFSKLLEPYFQRAPGLKKLGIPAFSMYSWLNLAQTTFNLALEKGEVFHLWGHSWEIEKYGMWNELEKFLKYIRNRKNSVYVTNSDLLKQNE